MSVFGAGNAFNQFGTQPEFKIEPASTTARQFITASASTAAKQFVMAYSLDAFLAAFPQYFPTHIKIDVDGLENLVIFGADKTLENPAIKSLLVEFDSTGEDSKQAIEFIQSKGFRIHSKNQRIEQEFINYIFRRP